MPIVEADYTSINYEEVAASIGLKPKHMPMLIASFLEEATPILADLESAIASKDYANIKLKAHSIKGSAGNLKFQEIYEMAKEMEFAGNDADDSFDFNGYLQAIRKAIGTIPS